MTDIVDVDIVVNEKQKRMPDRRAWQAYVAAGVAVGIALFAHYCMRTTGLFLMNPTETFYPLVLLTHLPKLNTFLWIATLIVCLGLLGFVFKRRALTTGVFTLIIGLATFGQGTVPSLLASRNITPHQTIPYQDHVYQLVVMHETTIFDAPTKSYGILQCDGSGLWCSFYSSPYSREKWTGRDRGDMGYENFDVSGALFIDSADNLLKLRVAEQVYSINSNERRVWRPEDDIFD